MPGILAALFYAFMIGSITFGIVQEFIVGQGMQKLRFTLIVSARIYFLGIVYGLFQGFKVY